MASIVTPTASPLLGLFGLLGANAANGQILGNGFGVAGLNTGVPSFATALNSTTLGGKPATGADALLKAVAAQKAASADKEEMADLGSADLLMSDLMAINLQALQPGETVTLPNGWSLSADQDGLLTLQNEAAGIAFPPFTKDQLEQALGMFSPALPQSADAKGDKQNAQKEAVNGTSAKTSAAAKIAVDADSSDQGKSTVTNPLVDLVAAAKDARGNPDAASRHTGLLALFGAQGNGTNSPASSGNGANNAAAAGLGAATSVSTGQSHQKVAPLQAATEGLLLNTPLSDGTIVQGDAAAFSHSLQQQFGIRTEKDGSLTGTQPMSTAQLQVVIQKLAERGEAKTLTVRLDPPELGRVEVNLSTARDKSIRASIMVEKPEALNLLQKDMGALEKALHNAGLSLEDGSVSLNLAQDNGQGGSFMQQAMQEMWQEKNAQNFAANGEIDMDLAIDVSGQSAEENISSDGGLNVVI